MSTFGFKHALPLRNKTNGKPRIIDERKETFYCTVVER